MFPISLTHVKHLNHRLNKHYSCQRKTLIEPCLYYLDLLKVEFRSPQRTNGATIVEIFEKFSLRPFIQIVNSNMMDILVRALEEILFFSGSKTKTNNYL